MAKRFTDSEKWRDVWFRRLPADQKLGYLYLLDLCDLAGTIELDTELAEFQMGTATDWKGLVKGSEGRLVELPNGRIWIAKFIAFQHGKLSDQCNAHKSALRLVERYELPVYSTSDSEYCTPETNESKDKPTKGSGRVEEPLVKGPGIGKGKSKGKKKEKEEWVVPSELDTPQIRQLLDEFATMRRTNGKPIKSLTNTSRLLKHFESIEHLAYALEFCIANGYQGLKPEYRPTNGTKGPVTFAKQVEANSEAAGREFVDQVRNGKK